MPNQNQPGTNLNTQPPATSGQPAVAPPPIPPAATVIATDAAASPPPPPIMTASDKPPVEKPVSNPPPLDISPVVVAGGNKKGTNKKAFVATIFGLLLLVGGVIAGLTLTKQQQDIREEAFIPPGEEATTIECGTYAINITEKENSSCPKIESCTAGTTAVNDVANYSTTWTVSINPGPPAAYADLKIRTWSTYCPENACGTLSNGQLSCGENNIVSTEETIRLSAGNKSKDYTVTRPSDSGLACGSYQTFIEVEALNCDGTPKKVGRDGFCQTGKPCTLPSESPSEVSCLDVRAYTVDGSVTDPDNWTRLSATDLKDLKADDIIYLAVVGKSNLAEPNGGFLAAQFDINGTPTGVITDLKPKGAEDAADTYIFYYRYVIPEDTKDFDIRAHLRGDGWVIE